ncbi:MAG: hypothetical protein KGH98_04195 [Candidatus Micrarchaeota archaeon]|nr:hypothetical protein [Candidatus Micrarchaeota archaeon]
MVVNPDDLLIFQSRKKTEKKEGLKAEQPEVKKPEAKPQPVTKPEAKPAPQQPARIELPGVEYRKVEQPKERPAVAKVQPAPAPRPQPERKIIEKPREAPAPKVAEAPKPKVEVYRPKPTIEMEIPRPAPAPAYRPEPAQRGKVAPPQGTMEQVKAAEEFFSPPSAMEKSRAEQRDSAKGMKCTWHQWRDAYAVCELCGRPFCYEDTMEYRGKYYCLQDIDKVSEQPTPSAEAYTYTKLGLASGGLMLAAFLVFLYFAAPEVIYVVGYANSVGFFDFAKVVNFDYIAAILGVILTGLGVVSALLIFLQAKGGFPFGLFVGFLGVVLFSYQFLNSSTLYAGIISVLDFAAMVALIYSRSVAYGAGELLGSQQEQLQLDWPNAGRF